VTPSWLAIEAVFAEVPFRAMDELREITRSAVRRSNGP
jgi:hypothetical protein